MGKFINCKCGKRYKEGNNKHFESLEHKKYIQDEKIKKSDETHIIVYDIDKVQLMEYLKSKGTNKRKFIINDDNNTDTDDSSGDVFETD